MNREEEETGIVVAYGEEWSLVSLLRSVSTYLAWLIVARFERLARQEGHDVEWFPGTSQVVGKDNEESMRYYDDLRQQAIREVKEAHG